MGPIDGLVYPPAKFGHSCVDSWKFSISAAVSPGDQAIDAAPAHQWSAGVTLQDQDKTIFSISYHVTICLMENQSHTGVLFLTAVCGDLQSWLPKRD